MTVHSLEALERAHIAIGADIAKVRDARHKTDTGNAERMADLFSGEAIHVYGNGWHTWDGKRYAFDEIGAVQQLVKRTVRAMYAESQREPEETKRKALAKHALASESMGARAAMLSAAKNEPAFARTVADLDRDGWLFNAQNCTVDLRTGKPKAHDRGDTITKLAGASYSADASCPVFEAFLESIFEGNAELIAFVQRFIGYSLTTDVREQVLAFFYGGGSNGKSTLLEVILALMGDYAMPAAPGLLIAKKHEQHPTELADLRGARLVSCVEIGEGKRFDEETIKKLSGGDKIKARRMRENFFSFPPSHKIIVAANHKPDIRGTDYAIWRRLRLVPFNKTFTDAEKDPQLLGKLLAELPGVLNWAIAGCLAWQRDGLGAPAEVMRATDDYRAEQDQIGRFIRDVCAVDARYMVGASDLYRSYVEWCADAGEHEVSQKRFGSSLGERGFTADRLPNRRSAWRGVGLHAEGSEGSEGLIPLNKTPRSLGSVMGSKGSDGSDGSARRVG